MISKETLHAERAVDCVEDKFPLEAEPRASEEVASATEPSSEKVEEDLNAKVQALEEELKQKNDILRSQDNEINNLKSNVDVLVGRVRKLTVGNNQPKPEPPTNPSPAEQPGENSNSKVATLEAQIRKIQEIVRGRESAVEALERNLTVKIEDLEAQLKNKEKLLLDRDRQISYLETQLKTSISRIKEMSGFLRQAEALASFNDSDLIAAAANQGNVSADLFDRIIRELSQIIGPMATVIVRHDVVMLGESIDRFPRRRLAELLDRVTKEIADENLKRGFRERILRNSSLFEK